MKFFITGTGTDVGKTAVSSVLVSGLSKLCSGRQVHYFKPVQTGPKNEDASAVETVSQKLGSDSVVVHPSFIQYEHPMSPDQAYLREKAAFEKGMKDDRPVEIQLGSVVAAMHSNQGDVTVYEGAGGVYVPLNQKGENWTHVLREHSDVQTIVVADSQLGTLNHTALTILGLQARGIDPLCVILSGPIHQENRSSLERDFPKTPVLELGELDFRSLDELNKNALAISEQVMELAKTRSVQVSEKTSEMLSHDDQYVWHPFTQHKGMKTPLAVVRADGPYLYLADGRRFFDGIGSWWVNFLGHGRQEIARVIAEQQQTLDHVVFAGATHKPATALAAKLIQSTGSDFSKVFYSDNGSTAVEVAAKMAFQFQKTKGKKPSSFLALNGSYHGDTFGAMSLGAKTGFHTHYEELFFDVKFLDPLTTHESPYHDGGELSENRLFEQARRMFAAHGDEFAGVVLEPLLQGAGGMLVQNEKWTLEVCRLAKERGIPIIFDEVFTGMGRTGTMFAYQKLGIKPDILVTSKGLTGGNLPLAVTLATGEIFEAFLSDQKADAFLHGHSFTANPIACAAACETLSIYEREDFMEKGQRMEADYFKWFEDLREARSLIKNFRAVGSVMAFELNGTGSADYFASGTESLIEACAKKELFIRPLGNTVYLAPPLATTSEQLCRALDALSESLKEVSTGAQA